jgi:diketogulonate reductase-like aldo/keto reductase
MKMPILGIGTFALSSEQAADSVYWALKDGYKLIDTANAYNNEEGVARGIQRAIDEGVVSREDFFVTAKIWPDAYNMEGIDATLERLGLYYVDLMLLHQPFGDITAGYQAMEQAVAQGKVKAIGLSNFEVVSNFDRIMEIANIPPAVLQVETHPYFQQQDTMAYIDQYGIVIEAWYPLGGRGNTQILFNDETIVDIANAHDKTAAQVILRWHLQAGHIVIPGSSNPDHILENISIFDFVLTAEEMSRINALNTENRFFNMPGGMTDEEMNDFIQNAENEIINQP